MTVWPVTTATSRSDEQRACAVLDADEVAEALVGRNSTHRRVDHGTASQGQAIPVGKPVWNPGFAIIHYS